MKFIHKITSHRRLYVLTFTGVVSIFAIAVTLYLSKGKDLAVSTPPASDTNLLAGEWHYMPGATPTASGLSIQYRGFNIVEQDGSGGQSNPPVNMYGTRLAVSGDFTVRAELKSIHGAASIQFYGQLPEISDEFRVEKPSVRMTVSGNTLTTALWDGHATDNLASQQPAQQQSFTITPSSTMTLRMTSQANELIFSVNNKIVGHMNGDGIFSSKQVWFGANAENIGDSFIISSLAAAPLSGGSVTPVNTAAVDPFTEDPNGLQTLATKQRPGFLIGGDVALWATSSSAYSQTIFGGNFGIITPENAMKWQFTEPQPEVYDFHEADAVVNLALKNHLQVHGHALVFSEALPSWVQKLPTQTTAQKAYVQQVMVDHVTQLVSHFKGEVSEWDVVNEPFADYDDNGNLPQTFRNNVFYNAMGPDYIKIALEAAHSADPAAKLYINDYGNESDDGARWQATYNFLKSLKNEGVPLYGFGFESHIYDPATDDISNDIADNGKAILENNINALAGIGLKSRISEMDAPASDPGYAEDSSSQTEQFTGVLSICMHNPNCVAFSMWSLGNTDMYQGDDTNPSILEDTAVDSPFDQRMKPDSVYTALQQVLR